MNSPIKAALTSPSPSSGTPQSSSMPPLTPSSFSLGASATRALWIQQNRDNGGNTMGQNGSNSLHSSGSQGPSGEVYSLQQSMQAQQQMSARAAAGLNAGTLDVCTLLLRGFADMPCVLAADTDSRYRDITWHCRCAISHSC